MTFASLYGPKIGGEPQRRPLSAVRRPKLQYPRANAFEEAKTRSSITIRGLLVSLAGTSVSKTAALRARSWIARSDRLRTTIESPPEKKSRATVSVPGSAFPQNLSIMPPKLGTRRSRSLWLPKRSGVFAGFQFLYTPSTMRSAMR